MHCDPAQVWGAFLSPRICGIDRINACFCLRRDFAEAYAHGREVGSEALGVLPETFPATCPWAPEQVLTAPLEGPNSPFFAAGPWLILWPVVPEFPVVALQIVMEA